MQIGQHHIVTSRTARYFTLGNRATAKEIWIVLHGYGYLAEDFIQNFQPIASENVCIIAPEGLSRFYLRGFGGKIGASWMTREDRQSEIEDYINYLNNLYAEITEGSSATKIIGLGFSQGGPALLRWLANGKSKVSEAVLWSADIPRDLKFEDYREKNKSTRNWLVYSKSDPIVRQEIYDESIALFNKFDIPLQVINFEDGHGIPEATLNEFAARLMIA